MNKTKTLLIIIAIITLLVGCNNQNNNSTLMVVNGEKITEKDFQEYIIPYKKDIMRGMVDTVLINQKAKEMGIVVSDIDIDKEIKEYKNQFNTEEDFIVMLENNNSSLTQLRYNVKQQIIVDRIIDKLSEDIEITKEDIEVYFERDKDNLALYDITMLIVNTEEKLDKVTKKLSEGERFEDLIVKYGDEGSGNKEGIRQYELELPKEVFKMKEGEIYKDVITNYMGNLFVRMDKKHDTLEQLSDIVKNKIKQEKGYQEFNRVMAEKKDKSEIEFKI